MASTETTPPAVPEPETPPPPPTVVEVEKAMEPPPEVKTPAESPSINYFALGDLVLRLLLFASAVVAVVLILISKQTKPATGPAKFNYSPAFIYFVAAASVVGLYSIITTLLSFYALLKPPQLFSHFLILDVIVLGIVAAATGAAGAIAYTGWKGNSKLGWAKICGIYDKFCTYVGTSVAISLFATLVLTFLVLLSFYTLSKKVPK